ncbi:hypothetical protein MC885_008041 [Smutsia gigantea]|nr:hypothetical protein MC885_008041 [Smutsia gigantea]
MGFHNLGRLFIPSPSTSTHAYALLHPSSGSPPSGPGTSRWSPKRLESAICPTYEDPDKCLILYGDDQLISGQAASLAILSVFYVRILELLRQRLLQWL